MSSKYGFGSDTRGLKLPKADLPKKKPDSVKIQEALQAGKSLGFVSRDPDTRLKPGPKRKEPQDKVSIPGPKRVIDRFRAFASGNDMTLWQTLEHLLDTQEDERS